MRELLSFLLIGIAFALPQDYNYQQAYDTNSLSTIDNFYEFYNQPQRDQNVGNQRIPVISKYFYIHSAPEEDVDELLKEPVSYTRKNYQVVFVKGPTPSISDDPISSSKIRNQLKTVIYVLSKKSDQVDRETEVTPSNSGQVSGPAVFFIKYRTDKEAKKVQKQVQDSLGDMTEVFDEGVAPVKSFIGSVMNTTTTDITNTTLNN